MEDITSKILPVPESSSDTEPVKADGTSDSLRRCPPLRTGLALLLLAGTAAVLATWHGAGLRTAATAGARASATGLYHDGSKDPCKAAGCGNVPEIRLGMGNESGRGAGNASCARFGCGKYDAANECQCHRFCKFYTSCCSDYGATCKAGAGVARTTPTTAERTAEPGTAERTAEGGASRAPASQTQHHHAAPSTTARRKEGSCAEFGCVKFTPSHACQCNPHCRRFHSCCHDYQGSCNTTTSSTTTTETSTTTTTKTTRTTSTRLWG